MTKDATDVTGKAYVLTTNLDGKSGVVTVNGTSTDKAVDFVKPEVSTAEATDQTHVKVTFNKEVDQATAEEVTNYVLKDNQGNDVNVTSAKLAADKKSVTLNTTTLYGVVEYSLTVSNVKNVDKTVALEAKTLKFVGSEAPALLNYGTTLNGSELKDGFENTAQNIYVSFNQPLNALSVNNTTVKLYNVTDKVYVPATAAVDTTDAKNIKIASTNALALNKQYKIEISKAVQSLSGINISDDVTYDFIVGAQDGIANTAIDSTLAAVGGAVPNNTEFKVAFGFKIDESTLADAVKLIKVDDLGNKVADVAATVTYDSRSLEAKITPTNVLEGNAKYQVVVSNTLKNAIGIAVLLDGDVDKKSTSQQFTTAVAAEPTVKNVEIAKADNSYDTLVDGVTDIKIAGSQDTNPDIKVTFDRALKTVGGNYTLTGKAYLLAETGDKAGQYVPIDVAINGSTLQIKYNDAVGTGDNATLDKGVRYKLIVQGLKDATANENVMKDYSISFTTETMKPVVVDVKENTTKIESGATNFDPRQKLDITFDKEINSTNKLADNKAQVKLYKNGTQVDAATVAPLVTISGKVITIAEGAFEDGKSNKYKVVIGKDLVTTDIEGAAKLGSDYSFEFVTAASGEPGIANLSADVTYTTLAADGTLGASPVALTTGKQDVALNKAINVKFTSDKALDSASLTTANVVLKETVSGTVVSRNVALDNTGKIVSITPAADLKPATSYTLEVKNVKDTLGNVQKTPYSVVFRTQDTVGTTVSANFVNDAYVAKDGKLVFTFNKAVNAAQLVNANIEIKEKSAGAWGVDQLTSDRAITYNSATKELTVDLAKNLNAADNFAVGYNKEYQVTFLKSGITGLLQDQVFTFKIAADTVAPTVKQVYSTSISTTTKVANNATNVDETQNLIFEFNDKDLATSGHAKYVAPSVEVIDLATGLPVAGVTGTVADVPNGDTITIAGNSLSPDKKYRVTISGAKDTEGNVMTPYSIEFTTGFGATITANKAASYVSQNPGTTDRNVNVKTAKVGVTFDKEIDTTTVNNDSVYLLNTVTNEKVAVDVAFSGAYHDITLTPKADLAFGTAYKAVFTTDIRTVAGNKAVAKQEITFTTQADAAKVNFTGLTDKSGNTVVNNGLVQVADTAQFKLAFDQNIAASTAKATNVKIYDETDEKYITLLDGNIAVDGKTVIVSPLASLTAGHVYTLTATGLTDTSTPAKSLTSNVSVKFAVQQDTVSLTSNKSSLKVGDTAAQLTTKVGGADVTASATYAVTSKTGTADLTVNATTGAISSITGTGTVTITASHNGKSASTTVNVDMASPTVTAASIASNNGTPTLAKVGDEITLTFTASEAVAAPTVTIAGKTATVAATGTANQYTAKVTVDNNYPETAVTYSVSLTDLAGNAIATAYVSGAIGTVTVDKSPVAVTGVTDNQTLSIGSTPAGLTPATVDADVKTVVLTKGGVLEAGYTALGSAITDQGVYVLTVTDNAGNETVINFEITA